MEEEKPKVKDEAKIIEEFFQKWRENLNKELKQLASVASKISKIHHLKLTVLSCLISYILHLFLVFPISWILLFSFSDDENGIVQELQQTLIELTETLPSAFFIFLFVLRSVKIRR